MLLTNEEAVARLDNPENLIRRRENDKIIRQLTRVKLPEYSEDTCAIAPIHNGGRRPGDKNLTPEDRASVGAAANILDIKEVAETMQVSEHHARELAEGKHSNAQGTNPELVEAINDKLGVPHDLAIQKLTQALLGLDPSKEKSPSKLATIAGTLARVAEHTAPLKHDDPKNGLEDCKLVVYAPTVKQENHYQTVEIQSPVKQEVA